MRAAAVLALKEQRDSARTDVRAGDGFIAHDDDFLGRRKLAQLLGQRHCIFAAAAGGNADDALDLSQEAFIRAWRGLSQYQFDAAFSTWLYRLTRNVCIDFLRKQKRMVDSDSMDAMAENGFEPADDSPTPEAALLDRESTGDISRALDQLPADMRTVLILYALEKQRYEDIAQITGVSVGTVKSRLNRARQKLAAILANQREQNEKSSVLPSERRTGK